MGYITEITVKGLGGCINYEMILIEQALQAVGIKVEVVNNHTHNEHEDDCTVQEYIKHRNKLTIEKGLTVKLVADHQPWGG